MIPKKASFYRFDVEPEVIIGRLPGHRPVSWPPEWERHYVENVSETWLNSWINSSAVANVQYQHIEMTSYVVAFADSDDATMFILSHNESGE